MSVLVLRALVLLGVAALLCAVAPAAAQTCDPESEGQCQEGLGCCQSDCGRWACRDFARDAKHCNGCNKKCGSGGALGTANQRHCCPVGNSGVSACVDLRTNAQHCGECGNQCSAGKICVNQQCKCPPGTMISVDGCTQCPDSTFSSAPDSAQCSACPPYTSTFGSCGAAKCSPCRATARPLTEESPCDPTCPANTRTVETESGDIVCEACPARWLSAPAALRCTKCAEDQAYVASAGAQLAYCTRCPSNQLLTVARDGCQFPPPGYGFEADSEGATDIIGWTTKSLASGINMAAFTVETTKQYPNSGGSLVAGQFIVSPPPPNGGAHYLSLNVYGSGLGTGPHALSRSDLVATNPDGTNSSPKRIAFYWRFQCHDLGGTYNDWFSVTVERYVNDAGTPDYSWQVKAMCVTGSTPASITRSILSDVNGVANGALELWGLSNGVDTQWQMHAIDVGAVPEGVTHHFTVKLEMKNEGDPPDATTWVSRGFFDELVPPF